MKENKGITLVALVVTVIVLIILASVTLVVVLGNNGIIGNAQNAKNSTELAEIKEQIQRDFIRKESDAAKNRTEVTEEDVREVLSKYGTIIEEDEIIGVETPKGDISLEDLWSGASSLTDPKYSLDIVINDRDKLLSFYSTDNGTTWTAMTGNELHLASFTTDILIYFALEGEGYTSNMYVNGTRASWQYTYNSKPTIDKSEYHQFVSGCQKITLGESINEIWEIILVS